MARKENYRVMLRGENFLINLDGQPTRVGFYTTRFVKAKDPVDAENTAVDLVRADKKLSSCVLNGRDDPPMVYLEELDLVRSFKRAGTGYTFFPADSDSAKLISGRASAPPRGGGRTRRLARPGSRPRGRSGRRQSRTTRE
jgi:hypothetical protein